MATPAVNERSLHVPGLDDAPGVRLNVALAGDPAGPAVLLLHGFPDSWQLWRHQIAALAGRGYRVVAPDLRGFGRSDRPSATEAYAQQHLLGDITGILDAEGVERCAVVGHDWGAVLAWRLAREAPERVAHLTAVSVGHPAAGRAAGIAQLRRSWYVLWFLFPGAAERVLPADDWRFFREWGWAGTAPGSDPDLDRQVADLGRPGALTAGLNWYRANNDPARIGARPPGGPPPPRIACPVLGVWSSEDPFLTEEQMTGSARHVDGPWRYERFDGVDHWVPVHAADRLSALLLDALPPPG